MERDYTDIIEDRLYSWDTLDDTDGDFDYTSAIEYLNSTEENFRSFGDSIYALIKIKYPDVKECDLLKFIEKGCINNGVCINEIATRNTFVNWFKNGTRPKKGSDSRERIFALAFALKFSIDETSDLFHKAFLDRAFDFRNVNDIIYYFCIQNNLSWTEAKRIKSLCNIVTEESDDKTVYTSVIQADISDIQNVSDLVNYIQKHKHNLSQCNVTAKSNLDNLMGQAKNIVRAEIKKFNLWEQYSGSWADEDTISTNLMCEVIMGVEVSTEVGTTTIFNNARLPQEIKNRFPEAVSFSKDDPTYEAIRKQLILLFSYVFWYNVENNKKAFNAADIYDEYMAQLNALLYESGMSKLYYGNPYDWLFLFCTYTCECPLQSFREIMSQVLSDEDEDIEFDDDYDSDDYDDFD